MKNNKITNAMKTALVFAVLAMVLPVAHIGLASAGYSNDGSPLLAQTPPILPPSGSSNNTAPVLASNKEELVGRLCDVVDFMFVGLIIVAIFFVLLAAYYYVSSTGDPEQGKKAGKMLIYVVIAVVVGLFAKSVPLVVASILSVTLKGCGA